MVTERWKFVSEDADTISLHDCYIDRVEEAGMDLILHFDEGFDVTNDNPLNPTGRHRNTGPAAIILKNWRFLEGTFNRDVKVSFPDGTQYYLPEEPLNQEQLAAFSAEVLDFGWNPETGEFRMDGDGGIYYDDPDIPDGSVGFVVLRLCAAQALFCWNDLPRDAWFQDWPKK